MRQAYDDMEMRVQQRTSELVQMNTRLQAEIAERERIEQALRISEDRYERAINAADVGVWDWDIETNTIYLSPNLKAMLGYQDDEIRNHMDDWGTYVYPDDCELVMSAATAHLNGKTPIYEVEHRMVHKDGSIRWFIARGNVVRDDQGKPIRMSGTDNDITERKRMENTLRESEERYRLISELVSDYAYAFRIEQDGTFVCEWMISEAFSHITGFSQEEIVVVHGSLDTVLEEDREHVKTYQSNLMSGLADMCEFRIVCRTGDIRWIQDHAQPVWDSEQNRVIRIYGAAKDITEQKQAEEALRESEEQYRSIITTMHEGVILHDKDGAIREWNTRAKQMVGRTTEKLLGYTTDNSTWTFVHEDGTIFEDNDHPSLVALHTSCPCSNVVMGIDKSNGTLTWLLINAQPLFRDSMTSPWGVVTTFTDITELKQAQQALTYAYTELEKLNKELGRSRDLLRTLFDGLHDGLVLLDNQGRVLALNQTIATIQGYAPHFLVNRSWIEVCQQAHHPFPVKLVTQTLKDGTPHHCRERYAGTDPRSPRILDIQTLPIIGDEQQLDQIVVHIVDVTEQLTLEAIAIHHERLAAGGALAATVAHEINTPLQSINHCLFLAYDLTDPQRDTYLTMARDEIARISQIVRQLLDLHRPISAVPASFAINPLVERVLTLVSGSLTKQQIVVKRELTPDIPLLYGHADQITQVIMNLIMNAKRAMPDGGTLSVQTMMREKGVSKANPSPNTIEQDRQKLVALSIEDTGTGMSLDVQERIFESFFTTSPSGLGLGLTISQRIIKQHGGQISVHSVPNQGSKFHVLLPLNA
jgi:PAS domain S-box-containing protein